MPRSDLEELKRRLSSMLYGEYKYISIVTGLAILYTHKHGELSGVYVNPIYIYKCIYITITKYNPIHNQLMDVNGVYINQDHWGTPA